MKEEKFKIGIDVDNTITASVDSALFFAFLTNALKGKVEIYIITNRDNTLESIQETEQTLSQLDIYYDVLRVTDKKAEYILEQGINVYFEDTDEMFADLPESVTVFKIREVGNFDFTEGVHKWIYGKNTGINVDER